MAYKIRAPTTEEEENGFKKYLGGKMYAFGNLLVGNDLTMMVKSWRLRKKKVSWVTFRMLRNFWDTPVEISSEQDLGTRWKAEL